MVSVDGRVVVIAAAMLAGCWGEQLGSATIDGTVSGYPAHFDNVVAIASPDGWIPGSMLVRFTTITNGCEAASFSSDDKDSMAMELLPSGTVAQAYQFRDQDYGSAEAYFHVWNDDGSDLLDFVDDTSGEVNNFADSGTITLLDVTRSTVNGTLDLVFPKGHLAGRFSAANCSKD